MMDGTDHPVAAGVANGCCDGEVLSAMFPILDCGFDPQ